MPTTTPAPLSVPYMIEADPLADVAAIMQSLAERVDKLLPARGQATINLASAASGSVAVVFPAGKFTSAPNVQATVIRGASFYVVSVTNVTKDGCTIYVQHANSTAFTAAVLVDWSAGAL